MKQIIRIPLVLVMSTIILLTSCGGGGNTFETLNADLIDKFGEDAYYKSISITPVLNIGDIVNVTVSKDPSSMQMEEWTRLKGAWEKNAVVHIEMEEEGLLTDFMYQLNNEVSIAKLNELVELSKVSLTKEKSIEKPTLMIATMECPDKGGKELLDYVIFITPEHGGTSFIYTYDLNGELKSMKY